MTGIHTEEKPVIINVIEQDLSSSLGGGGRGEGEGEGDAGRDVPDSNG